MRKEKEFLYLCSHPNFNISIEIRDSLTTMLASNGLDWQEILKEAEENEISSLIYWNLKECRINIPIDIKTALEEKYFENAVRNTFLLNELKEIINALGNERIRIFPLKGAYLLGSVYRSNIALRRIEDIDILVQKKDVKSAEVILRNLGYYLSARHSDIHTTFRKEGVIPVIVELHWNIVNPISPVQRYIYKADIDAIWREGMTLENTFIYLCFHIFKEYFGQIKWYVDLDYFIRENKNTMDWNLLIKKAKDGNASKIVYWCLIYIRNLFNTPIPDYVINKVAPKEIGRIERKLFSLPLQLSFPKILRAPLYLYLIENTKDRIKAIFELLLYLPQKLLSLNQ